MPVSWGAKISTIETNEKTEVFGIDVLFSPQKYDRDLEKIRPQKYGRKNTEDTSFLVRLDLNHEHSKHLANI